MFQSKMFRMWPVAMVYCSLSFAQPDYDFSILPIPFTTQEQDIRTVLEEEEGQRIVLTEIRALLQELGYTPLNFMARLKKAKRDSLFKTFDDPLDAKSIFLEFADPDYYLETEVQFMESSKGNKVRLVITAFRTSTSESVANVIIETNKFYSRDLGRFIEIAIRNEKEKIMEALEKGLTSLQDQQLHNFQVHFTLPELSDLSFHTEMKDMDVMQGVASLGDLLEYWIQKSEIVSSYRLRGKVDKNMIFDKIAVKQGSQFMIKLKAFIEQLRTKENHPAGLRIKDNLEAGTYRLRIIGPGDS